MKKILVPTDFSDQALYALEIASQFARKYKAEIYLLHILELPNLLKDGPAGREPSELPEALFFMKLAHKQFDEIRQNGFLKEVKVHETVEFDGAFEGIMNYVNKYDIDTIIMGSHGASGLRELFIGSNTEKVVRHSKVPVLVIKSPNSDFKTRNFIFATDLQEDNVAAVSKAAAFAEEEGAELQLFYINTPDRFKTTEEITESFQDFIEKLGRKMKPLIIFNDLKVERGILNYARSVQADLIGIGTHGRKGIAHFFNGSLSEDLINHANRPVITYKI